ncbi:MAG: CsbD family protein [Steroidobacteraceae bacterium]|jgi:uncharacterized protein YjbJ (UPF0337 family)
MPETTQVHPYTSVQTGSAMLPRLQTRSGDARIRHQEQIMRINKDQVKGGVKVAKGAIREAAGRLVGNKMLEVKGNIQKNLGKAQVKLGDIKEHLKHPLK